MKEIWIMCLDSESGDHYHACEAWDHEPTKEEINEAKIGYDCSPLESDEIEDADFIVNGIPYQCFVYHKISKVTI